MKTRQADYVIVGGGTAGCVLAARLSEDPSVSIVVLEAGPKYRGLSIHIPAALGALYEKGAYHWPYKATPEPHAGKKILSYKMGRVVGGSSAINGLVWARGNPRDYDDWAAADCAGWSYKEIEPLFRRIEAFEDKTDASMGHDGPIPVTCGRPQDQVLSDAFLKSAAAAGYRINPNHNSGDQEGFCALHRNTRNGRRGDVYQGYIHPIRRRKNLTILPGHTAQKIEFDGTTATGVITRKQGEFHQFNATREVILSAGSVASPQLLELSGIGNPIILTAQGVSLLHKLPGVGENFHTHPTIKLTYACTKPVSIFSSTRPLGRFLAGLEWLIKRRGPAATNHFEAGAFIKSHTQADRPDIQLTFLPLALDGATEAKQDHGFQIYAELVGCKSRSAVHIQSPSIEQQPLFNFNFLKDPRDLDACREAVRVIRDVIAQTPFDAYRGTELEPGAKVESPDDIDAWLRETASLSHHLVGSCKMGPDKDEMAVVGSDLKVHGLQQLRVIDASIMPNVTTANTHATTIAIAEKGADLINAG